MKIIKIFLVLMATTQLSGMEIAVELADNAAHTMPSHSVDFYEAKCVAENRHYPIGAPAKNRVLKAQPDCASSFEWHSAKALIHSAREKAKLAVQPKPLAPQRKLNLNDKHKNQAPAQAILLLPRASQKQQKQLEEDAQVKTVNEKATKEIRVKFTEEALSKLLAKKRCVAMEKELCCHALDCTPPQNASACDAAATITENDVGIMLGDLALDWKDIEGASRTLRKDILFADCVRDTMDRPTAAPDYAASHRYLFDSKENFDPKTLLAIFENASNLADEKELADNAGAAACSDEWDVSLLDNNMADRLKLRARCSPDYNSGNEYVGADLRSFQDDAYLDYLFAQPQSPKVAKLALPWASDVQMLDFCKANKNSFVAIVWPNAQGFNQDIIELFNEHGTVYSQKNVALSNDKIYELVWMAHRDVIAHKERILDVLQMKDYMAKHVRPYLSSAQKNTKVARVFAVTFKDLQTQRLCKQMIRALFNMGFSSIHINDTHAETIELAQYFFGADHELAT